VAHPGRTQIDEQLPALRDVGPRRHRGVSLGSRRGDHGALRRAGPRAWAAGDGRLRLPRPWIGRASGIRDPAIAATGIGCSRAGGADGGSAPTAP
jgi:hypothetical protein